MYKLKYIIFLAFLFFQRVKAQQPHNDAAWILQDGSGGTPDMSDEFSGTSVNTSKWVIPPLGGWIFNGAEVNYPGNLSVNSGTLTITADTLSAWVSSYSAVYAQPPANISYAYQGGSMHTVSSNYKFGYIEILAKYPTGKYSLWPAFWLVNSNCSATPPWIEEIDIVENGADVSFEGHTIGTNIHLYDTTGTCISYSATADPEVIDSLPFLLSSAYHKYALEWAPDRIYWYVDDSLVRTVYDASGKTLPQHGMYTILNFAVSPWGAFLPTDWTGIFRNGKTPTGYKQDFKIDYLRYYKLGVDCSTPLVNLCTPSGYDRKVKKSIATDPACTPTFNPTTYPSSYTLRATNSVLLDVGTVIDPSGTGYFAVEIMACPN